jgi:hypothetical protein
MKRIKSVDQLTIAKVVATRMGMAPSQIIEVIEMEQKTTMNYVKRGYRVVKKNYLTITPKAKKSFVISSPLTNQTYMLPEKVSVRVKVGMGFKNYVSNKGAKMPNRLCRFVKDVKINEKLTLNEAKPN